MLQRTGGWSLPAAYRTRFILVSPILVVVLGHFAAQLFTGLLGRWAWVGVFPVYWGSMLAIVGICGGASRLRSWSGRPRGSRWWLVLAVAVGLIAFPLILLPNIQVMTSPPLVAAWLAFAVVNPICEEVYWRGFLLDETGHLPRAFGVAYSGILFVAVHPFVLGVFSHTMAFDSARPFALTPFIIVLVVVSIVWSLLYLRTRSLRWPTLSHFLTDLGNLSIFVLMNIV